MLAEEKDKSIELNEFRQRQEELYAAEQKRLENLITEREKREVQYEVCAWTR